jgi:hypothetical protein
MFEPSKARLAKNTNEAQTNVARMRGREDLSHETIQIRGYNASEENSTYDTSHIAGFCWDHRVGSFLIVRVRMR